MNQRFPRINHPRSSPLLHDLKLRAASLLRRTDLEAGIDALLELRHMGNDADKTAGALQIDQCIHRAVQCFRIQRTEAFVDEQGIEVYAALPCLHDIGKPQGK